LEANGYSVKNFCALHGNQRFITTFTTAHPFSTYWSSCFCYAASRPASLRCLLILNSHLSLGLPRGLLSDFHTKTLYAILLSATCHMSSPPHPPWFYLLNITWWGAENMRLSLTQFSPASCFSSHWGLINSSAPSDMFFLQVGNPYKRQVNCGSRNVSKGRLLSDTPLYFPTARRVEQHETQRYPLHQTFI
jgi:hypothetical protein